VRLAIAALLGCGVGLLIMGLVRRGHSSCDNNNGGGDEPVGPAQLELERQFRKVLTGKNLGEYLNVLTSKAHIAGSEENYEAALYVQSQMRSFGLEDVELQPFDVLLCYPTQRRSVSVFASLEGPLVYEALLKEQNYSVDPSTELPVPATYLAYSASGHVKAEVVYANYGQLEDFQLLEALGVNVTGKIALMRSDKHDAGQMCKRALHGAACSSLN
jgi:N-acetylated-alpha-linked acidic dipeptidase